MHLRGAMLMSLILLFSTRAEAIVRVSVFRALTESEIATAEKRIGSKYPGAEIDRSSMVVVQNDSGRKWVALGFESERRRVNERFCGSVSDYLYGDFTDAQEVSWKTLETMPFPNVLYQQRLSNTCYSANDSRRISVTDGVSGDSVAWLLDNEQKIWNDYLFIAFRRYGDDFGIPLVVPEDISVEFKREGCLMVSFFDGVETFFVAELNWIAGRWMVSEAYIGMP